MQKKVLQDLKLLMQYTSPAEVAVLLGYKDTRAIRQWIFRKRVPKGKIERISKLASDRLNKLIKDGL